MKERYGRAQIQRMQRVVLREHRHVSLVEFNHLVDDSRFRVQDPTGRLLLGYGPTALAAWRAARDFVVSRKLERALLR